MSDSEPQSPKPPWVNHYFAVIPNAAGAAILMLPTAEGWQLPYTRAQDLWLADSNEIIPVFRATLGIDFDFTLLRYVSVELNSAERWDSTLYVLEPAQPLHQPPLGGQWVDRILLEGLPLASPAQRQPLLDYLDENQEGAASPRIDPRRAPWARPGWFATASAWIEAAIAELGYTQLGPVEQRRNWSISSLLVAPTTAGRVYFKAAAPLPLFVNEPALTHTLSELFPGHVPTPLKIDRERRWMLMEDFGKVARGDEARGDHVDYAPILRAYGKLQRESAQHLDRLAAAGCMDRRLDVLASQIDPLVADPLTQSALTPDEHAELVALAPQLKARCARVAAYNLPATLLHGDLHPGNITQRNGDFVFFDWTDAAVGFPFVDHFLLYFELDDEEGYPRWRDAYLEAWQDFGSPQRLLEVWELAKPLCALHHSISYLSICHNIEPLTRDELFHGLPDNLRRLIAAMRT